MSMRIRAARPDDLRALYDLAKLTGGGFTNLPPDRAALRGKLERAEFDRSWVRVEPKSGDRSLIMLSAQGRTVEVGRFMRPELRPALASEIRMALRAA